jgi:hypothetical protein
MSWVEMIGLKDINLFGAFIFLLFVLAVVIALALHPKTNKG